MPPFVGTKEDRMPRELKFHGRKIEAGTETYQMPDGRLVERDLVLHPGAVAILPLVDADHVCLLHNHRFIVGETLWEIPAGTLEPGEAPDDAAVRELAEETGYRAARWRKLTAFYPSPGILSERTHLYMAQELTPGPLHLEAGEQLTPHVVAWSEALAWVLDGRIHDAKTLVALLWWDRLRTGDRAHAAT
jgi:ADP-ribose pyrophosphatase